METKKEEVHLLERRFEIDKKMDRLQQEQNRELEIFRNMVIDEHTNLILQKTKEMSM